MKKITASIILSLILFVCSFVSARVVFATDYYVDATNGNDSRLGTSTDNAWQTITKVNSTTFSSGDSVFFKKGETWTLTSVLVATSGVSYGSYGSGNRPILDGNNTVNVFDASGKDRVSIQGIEVKNALDFGISYAKSGAVVASNGTINDCVVSHSGNDNIIIIDGSHDVVVTNTISYGAYLRVSDGRLVTNFEIADDVYNITVDGLTSYNSAQVGITVHAHSGEGYPYNITVKNSSFYNNGVAGIYMMSNSAVIPGTPNVLFLNDVSYNNTDGSSGGEGLFISNDGGATYVTGVTFRNLRVYGNNSNPINIKGDSIRFETSFISGKSPLINSSVGVTIYNCTIYNTLAQAALRITGARMANLVMKNSIIRQTIAANVAINVAAGTGVTGFDINYNLYKTTGTEANTHWSWLGTNYTWANWKSTSGMDTNSPTPADPLFVDAANNDFRLQSTSSPAYNVGVNVGLSYSGSAPDAGAYEYAVANTPSSLAQSLAGNNVTFSFSMASLDPTDTLTPRIEVQPIGTSFTNTANLAGSAVSYSGTAVTGTINASNFGSGRFHWQVSIGNYVGNSSWVSYGGNGEGDADFIIDFSSAAPPTVNCTDTVPNYAPYLYIANGLNKNDILLLFNPIIGQFDHYILMYGLEQNKYLYSANISGSLTNSFTVKSLSPGTKYYFKLAAVNGCSTGPWSNEISGKTSAGNNFITPNDLSNNLFQTSTDKSLSQTNDTREKETKSKTGIFAEQPDNFFTILIQRIFDFFRSIFFRLINLFL